MQQHIHELAGIGIGPFNLGLAALCHTIGIDAIFLEREAEFSWHGGLLIDDTTLQVPFYADLVTPADPCSRFSYLSYLHTHQKLFRFAIREKHFIKRTDYNNYCRWVAGQLTCLHFNAPCDAISFDEKELYYIINACKQTILAKHIVIGVGTIPWLPPFARAINDPFVFHSSEYLYRKEKLLRQKDITIIGSGQSAAEIFYDLLKSYPAKLSWFTRSEGFLPMDYSSFSLEKTSLDYIDYFYSLPDPAKPSSLARQNYLYKGINRELLGDIYALLDDSARENVHLHPACELVAIRPGLMLDFHHLELLQSFQHQTQAVILATGYYHLVPLFVSGIHSRINWDREGRYQVNRNYSVDNHNTVFVQNADGHTHGFTSGDLGMGPYRNATILNTILGYEHYKLERGIAFQKFGLK